MERLRVAQAPKLPSSQSSQSTPSQLLVLRQLQRQPSKQSKMSGLVTAPREVSRLAFRTYCNQRIESLERRFKDAAKVRHALESYYRDIDFEDDTSRFAALSRKHVASIGTPAEPGPTFAGIMERPATEFFTALEALLKADIDKEERAEGRKFIAEARQDALRLLPSDFVERMLKRTRDVEGTDASRSAPWLRRVVTRMHPAVQSTFALLTSHLDDDDIMSQRAAILKGLDNAWCSRVFGEYALDSELSTTFSPPKSAEAKQVKGPREVASSTDRLLQQELAALRQELAELRTSQSPRVCAATWAPGSHPASKDKCLVCDVLHADGHCWVQQPDRAPSRWMPRSEQLYELWQQARVKLGLGTDARPWAPSHHRWTSSTRQQDVRYSAGAATAGDPQPALPIMAATTLAHLETILEKVAERAATKAAAAAAAGGHAHVAATTTASGA